VCCDYPRDTDRKPSAADGNTRRNERRSTLETTICLAAEAHYGATDMAGAPYILHALGVMLSVDSEEERMVDGSCQYRQGSGMLRCRSSAAGGGT
jgi:hypothetical protein